jgi:hypothetical protein
MATFHFYLFDNDFKKKLLTHKSRYWLFCAVYLVGKYETILA